MDNIDYEIVVSSEEDYETLYANVMHIAAVLRDSPSVAIKEFFSRCDAIRKIVPLAMYESDKPYGDMRGVEWSNLDLPSVVNENNELAGLPYYFTFARSEKEGFGYYASLVKRQIKY